jgi:carbon storage regulator
MLVLSRKHGESIIIDRDVKVHVIEVRNNVVRFGIEAPKEISVHRSEICDRLRANKAAFSSPKEKS